MSKTTISFFPTHIPMTEEEHLAAIAKYRDWLDQHGDYGRLYMMSQDRKEMKRHQELKLQTPITGVDIYDSEIAMLFRLMFEI
jgi:hypothetical protein